MQIPTILPRVVLHVARRVVDPAPRVVDPVRAGRVEPPEILVHPRQGGDSGHARSAHREEPGYGYEEDGAKWDPYGAGKEDQWCEENEAEDGGGDGEAGEEEQDAAGDDEGQEADELGGVGGVFLEFADYAGCGVGAGVGSLRSDGAGVTIGHC